jgi:AcrR family transcriptional regulator
MTTVIIDWSDVYLSLREKKKQKTKKRIFEVAIGLFKEKGFENTSVDEITRGAGIGKGTFFNYFKTKGELLIYYGDQKEELIKNLIKDDLKKDIPAEEKIINVLTTAAKVYEGEKDLARKMILEYMDQRYIKPVRSGSSIGEGRSARLTRFLIYLLQEGVERGEVKKGVDIQDAAENLTSIFTYSYLTWLRSDTDSSFSGNISKKVDMIFDGIGS